MSNLVKIAFQASEGLNVEFVAHEALKQGSQIEYLGCPDYNAINSAFDQKEITHAILPYENSLSGTSLEGLDFLLRHPKLQIVAEVAIQEDIVVAGSKTSSLDKIRKVIIDGNLINETKSGLNKLFSGNSVTFEIQTDIKAAVNAIQNDDQSEIGFVGLVDVAKKHGLNVLSSNILENSHHNFTRYFIISNQPVYPERHQLPKTTLAITLKNTPGSLMKVFSTFALRDINICKVESRASFRSIRPGSAWEYTMIVDIDGAPNENEKVKKAIENLDEVATSVQVLGSYPRYFPSPTSNLAPVGL